MARAPPPVAIMPTMGTWTDTDTDQLNQDQDGGKGCRGLSLMQSDLDQEQPTFPFPRK